MKKNDVIYWMYRHFKENKYLGQKVERWYDDSIVCTYRHAQKLSDIDEDDEEYIKEYLNITEEIDQTKEEILEDYFKWLETDIKDKPKLSNLYDLNFDDEISRLFIYCVFKYYLYRKFAVLKEQAHKADWLADVGKKISCDVRVVHTRPQHTKAKFRKRKYVVMVEQTTNAYIVCSTSNATLMRKRIGDEFRLDATVKAHKIYDDSGIKETVVRNPKPLT